MDLGLLSAGKAHTFRFGLHNHNPVAIELKSVDSDLSTVKTQILGIFKGNTTAFKTSYLYGNITDAVSIFRFSNILTLIYIYGNIMAKFWIKEF